MAWQDQLALALPEGTVLTDTRSREKYSKDFYHFSPILIEELDGYFAECVVRPSRECDIDQTLSIAAEHRVPVTVRGGGTGNYGQAVPLSGGIVLDLSRYDRVKSIEDGIMTAEAGAKLGQMEQAARDAGHELRVYPSTFQTATIGGFILGGTSGVGSITWGSIWEDLVTCMTVKTVERSPRTLNVRGNDILPYIHNYGTAGVITSLSVRLATRTEWEQWAISFNDFTTALQFGLAFAEASPAPKRLVSIHEWPIPSYFTPLTLPHGQSVCLMEVASTHSQEVRAWAQDWGGSIALYRRADHYHRGMGVSDFSFNHTTQWAMQRDSQLTYLQATFKTKDCVHQMDLLKAAYSEMAMHVELIKSHGALTVSAIPILPFVSAHRLDSLMRFCESIGVSIENPHTYRLEFGSRSPALRQLIDLKKLNDPSGLLNPGKLHIAVGKADRAV